jgi:hypothetical protein
MSYAKILPVTLLVWLMGNSLMAQLDTNRFELTILPQPGTYIVSESSNVLSLAIANWAVTNIETVTDPEGIETTVTNLMPLLSNLTVVAFYPGIGTNVVRLDLTDDGVAPDRAAQDGIFSTSFFSPFTQVGYYLPVTFLMRGLDISRTNESGEVIEAVRFTNQFVVEYFLVPRPSNDKMTNAFKIPPGGGIAWATNNYASIEPGEPKHAKMTAPDASIWWVWSSPVSTNVLIDTAGSYFSPVLAVYTGNSVMQLVEVASSSDDTANHLKAHVNFDAVAGETYRIAVAGKDSSTNSVGWIRLRVAPGAVPDTHPPLVSISSPTREALVTTEMITLTGSAKEPFPGDSGISNVVVQVNNDPPISATGSDSWSASIVIPTGTNVIRAFAVDYAGNIGPADSIVVRYVNPTNDLFFSAGRLTGVGGVAQANNRRATREPGEPLHAGNVGGHSVWYYWRAPADGDLRLTTSGSTFDTLLALYLGTQLTNLVALAWNDDTTLTNAKYSELVFGVISNQLYYIAVDGYGGETGDLRLQYAFVTPTPGQFYNLTIIGSPGGSVSPPSGAYRSGARVMLTATPELNFEFAGWEGGVVSINNPLTIVMSQDLSVSAKFRLLAATNAPVTDGFELGNFKLLNWVTSGNAKWTVQTNLVARGKYAARSGTIGNGQSSSLILQTNMLAGAASFDLRVSSETGWDYLEFYLGTTPTLLQRWSGDVGWTNFVFNVPAGPNRLEWRYIKDGNFSGGLDAAFIDNLFVPLDPRVSEGGSCSLLINPQQDGQVQITVLGEPNRSYILEAAPDLIHWVPLGIRSSESGVIQFLDVEAPGYDGRFYRALAP